MQLLDARLEVAEEGEIHAQDTARIPLLGEGAHVTGDRDRLLTQVPRFAIVTLPDQRLAVGGKNLSPDTERWIRRHQVHGRLVLAECAFATGRMQVAAQSPVQESGPHRVRGRVHLEKCHPGRG